MHDTITSSSCGPASPNESLGSIGMLHLYIFYMDMLHGYINMDMLHGYITRIHYTDILHGYISGIYHMDISHGTYFSCEHKVHQREGHRGAHATVCSALYVCIAQGTIAHMGTMVTHPCVPHTRGVQHTGAHHGVYTGAHQCYSTQCPSVLVCPCCATAGYSTPVLKHTRAHRQHPSVRLPGANPP
jgi:hypothetical protein